MTKEEKKLYDKNYYLANKEKKVAQFKEYYANNKDAAKAYNEANKEKIAARRLRYLKSRKDGLYTVYYLHKENYIGMTSRLKDRMYQHKSNGKHVEDVEVINKYKTKREALDVEAAFHYAGYLGRAEQLYTKTKI